MPVGYILPVALRLAEDAPAHAAEPDVSVDGLPRAEWDAFVLGRARGNVMQSWGWAELKGRYGWSVTRIAARGPDGDVAAAMQLLFRRLGPGAVLAYAPRGPAVADLARDAEPALAVLTAARRLARGRRAFTLKLDPEWETDDPATALLQRRLGLVDSVFDVQHRLTYLVDLAGGEEPTLARVKSSTRRNIRIAERGGVEVDIIEDPAAAAARYYPLHLATAERKGYAVRARPQQYYRDLVESLQGSCPAVALVAHAGGHDLSGMIAAAAGPRLCFLFGGNTLDRDELRPSYLLHWHAMRWGMERGCSVYDMWGVPSHEDPHAPGAGYFDFKTRWNGRVARHLRCQDARLWGAAQRAIAVVEGAVVARRPLPD